MPDPLATWQRFLTSPAAPRGALSVLALDGFLTGIAVAPNLLMPGDWIEALWLDEEPAFENEAELGGVLGAVIEHYNAVCDAIDAGVERFQADTSCDYRPLFLTGDGPPEEPKVREWVGGFWQGIILDSDGLDELIGDKKPGRMLGPLLAFVDVGEEFEPDDSDLKVDLAACAAAIPTVILVLRLIGRMRAREPARRRPARVARKPGRNASCPCGSGRKYKRCCGAH
jgi:uncharacterized protein